MADKIFKRKIYDTVLKWKRERNGSTALLVKGARRIGKSTIVKEFAKREYKSFIAIDFAKASDAVKGLFDNLDNLDFLFLQLQALYHVTLHDRASAIIFDEVQLCPKARQAIKYLVEDGRYDYIETGSLLSIRKNIEGILLPSEETRITMFPMDYEEFLWAIGDTTTFALSKFSFDNRKPMGDAVNRELMRQFRLYMLIGGMPQSINAYLNTNNLAAADAVKREIIELYIDDLRKIDSTGKASLLFESIPGQLASSKLKFEPMSVVQNVTADKLGDIWKVLEDSLTVNFAYRSTDPNVGLGLHKDVGAFRIYLCDTGLFVTLAFWDRDVSDNILYQKLLSDKLSADLGYVYENAVAQMLRTSGHQLYYYTFPVDQEKKKYYEIDFLTVKGNKVNPIEVKSSGYKAHKSLDVFRERYSSRIGQPYILYTKDLRSEEGILYLPAYMTPFL
ncbi:MAG: AAA family ATPase [Lachnospiraceae bacterium]|nr:AAA family ATPase [Lachnospiraceae bacterium]